MNGRHAILPALVLLASSSHLAAEEFTVDVGGRSNSFSPSLLNIQIGDTVTWRNRGGTHNVRAINEFEGEFFSGAPSSGTWSFSHTFTSAGRRDYQCDPHSPLMRGAIIVEGDEEPANDFQINHGLGGAWFEPATAGQGILLDIAPDSGDIFAAWFTYNDSDAARLRAKEIGAPEHRWFTAFGPYDGPVATLDLTVTTGGLFDDPAAVDNSDAGSVGTLEIEFFSCTEAVARYDLIRYGLQGEMDLVRLLPDVTCESLAAEAQ